MTQLRTPRSLTLVYRRWSPLKMNQPRSNLRISGAVIASVLALVLSACGNEGGDEGTTIPTAPAAICPEVQEDAVAQAVAVAVIDRSASGASADLRAERMSDVGRLIRWAIEHGASLTIAYFDGSTASLDVDDCVAGLVMAPSGNNSRTRERSGNRLETVLENLIARRLNEPARATGSDALGAIRFGIDTARMLEANSAGPVVVLIASDFVATSGCLDLRGIPVGDDMAAADAVRYCVEASLVPDATGIHLILSGVGRTTHPEMMPTESQSWLSRIYEHVCDAAGAESCQVTSRIVGGIG